LRPAFGFGFWSCRLKFVVLRSLYAPGVKAALELYDAIVTEKWSTLTLVSVDE